MIHFSPPFILYENIFIWIIFVWTLCIRFTTIDFCFFFSFCIFLSIFTSALALNQQNEKFLFFVAFHSCIFKQECYACSSSCKTLCLHILNTCSKVLHFRNNVLLSFVYMAYLSPHSKMDSCNECIAMIQKVKA